MRATPKCCLRLLMMMVILGINALLTQKIRSNQLNYEAMIQLRNKLSKITNDLTQKIGVMNCEIIDLQTRFNMPVSNVSVAGRWCKKENHMFDRQLAMQLSHFFTKKMVASFGDGPGDYKKYMDAKGRLAVYDAYDVAPYGPLTSGGVVKFLDLTAPQYGLPIYDWVMALKVAEHIPSKYASIYIDNIVRHAASGIVLSWAVPGQLDEELGFVDSKPLSYVKNILSAKGFDIDMDASNVLQKKARFRELRRNVHVYRRRQDTPIVPEDA